MCIIVRTHCVCSVHLWNDQTAVSIFIVVNLKMPCLFDWLIVFVPHDLRIWVTCTVMKAKPALIIFLLFMNAFMMLCLVFLSFWFSYLQFYSRNERRYLLQPQRPWWLCWRSAYTQSSARTPNTPETDYLLHKHMYPIQICNPTFERTLDCCSYLQWASPSWHWPRPSSPWTTACRWLEQHDLFSATGQETVMPGLSKSWKMTDECLCWA